MQKILDWKNSATKQKEPYTGCIPTGYEFLLRMAGIKNVNYGSFQNDFDINKRLNDPNAANFKSVADQIQNKYPFIRFEINSFGNNEGQKKVDKIIEIIEKGQPALISLNITSFSDSDKQGWHIMPVIGIIDDKIHLIKNIEDNGNPNLVEIPLSKIVEIHETYSGGKDIAYLHI